MIQFGLIKILIIEAELQRERERDIDIYTEDFFYISDDEYCSDCTFQYPLMATRWHVYDGDCCLFVLLRLGDISSYVCEPFIKYCIYPSASLVTLLYTKRPFT